MHFDCAFRKFAYNQWIIHPISEYYLLPFWRTRNADVLQVFHPTSQAEVSKKQFRVRQRFEPQYRQKQMTHFRRIFYEISWFTRITRIKETGKRPPKKRYRLPTTNMQEANTNWDDLWQNELHIFTKKHMTNDEHTKNAFASGRRQLFRESLSEMKGSLDSFTNTFLLDLHDLWLQLSIFIWHTFHANGFGFFKCHAFQKSWWKGYVWKNSGAMSVSIDRSQCVKSRSRTKPMWFSSAVSADLTYEFDLKKRSLLFESTFF